MSDPTKIDDNEYDSLKKSSRLWNDSDSIMSDSMAGVVMMHRNLVYRDNCKAILRRDYNKMNQKVRIIGGGSLIDGPMYAGFVGPGMLTGAVLALPENSAYGIPTSDSIFELIQQVAKNDEETMNEVLLLVQECTEYFLNFMQAKKKAEEAKIPIKLLFVRDELDFKLNQKPLSARSPSGILLLYKIAGAMSEDEKSLNEIYYTCDEIMKDGIISSIGLYIDKSPRKGNQIQICKGDRLSDRESKWFPINSTTTKKVVESLMSDLINGNKYHKFPRESQLAIILDYFGGFTELEASIVMKEFLQQSNRFKYKIELILTGTFRTSLEARGFHLSMLNVSYNQQLLYYLRQPTVAFSWPKTSIREIHSPSSDIRNKKVITKEESRIHQNEKETHIVSVESSSGQNWNETTPEKSINDDQSWNQTTPEKLIKSDQSIDQRSKSDLDLSNEDEIDEISNEVQEELIKAEILLSAVQCACEALINCAHRIDSLDLITPQNFDKCGTRLAKTASTIASAIHKKHFADSNSANIIYQIASIFEQSVPDPQAEMYTIFFNVIGQAIEDEEFLEPKHWFEAFIAANNAIDEFTRGSKISDTLYAATSAFWDAFSKYDTDIIYPLGLAVSAAQSQTSDAALDSQRTQEKNINDYGWFGEAGAHALGIWLRGAYEGVKLKYSRPAVREKRSREVMSDSDEDEDFERAAKIIKVSHDEEDVDIYEDL